MPTELLLEVLLLAALAMLALQVVSLLRKRHDVALSAKLDALKDDNERLQRTLREEQRADREELQQGFSRFREHVGRQLASMSQRQARCNVHLRHEDLPGEAWQHHMRPPLGNRRNCKMDEFPVVLSLMTREPRRGCRMLPLRRHPSCHRR